MKAAHRVQLIFFKVKKIKHETFALFILLSLLFFLSHPCLVSKLITDLSLLDRNVYREFLPLGEELNYS